MKRLTKRGNKNYPHLVGNECYYSKVSYDCQKNEGIELLETALEKLAEYEDFEEIFRGKITNEACELLSDKEEFEKWLDRNKWIAKKCDEYARAEGQGLLLRLPCKVGDTIYYNEDNETHKFIVYSFDIRPLQEFVCNYEGIRLNLKNFGKTVFLTQEEAEQGLKELEAIEASEIESR